MAESRLPKVLVVQVDPHFPDQRVGPVGSPRPQQVEVLIGEASVALFVPRVEGQDKQLTERIGVHVARRMEEVRDVAPPVPVVIAKRHTAVEHVALGVHPVLRKLVGLQLSRLPTRGVNPVLESIHRHLPKDRRDRIVNLGDEHGEAIRRVLLGAHQALKNQHLAEDRRHLGCREGGAVMEDRLLAGQGLVHAVPQLVGEGLHVAGLAGVVEKDVRVGARHRPVAERTAALARGQGRVDPVLLKKPAGDLCHLRMKFAVGVQHEGPGLRPLVGRVCRPHRGVPVVIVQLVDPQKLLFEAVEPRHEVVPVRHGLNERVHRLVVHLIGEVALLEPVVVVPKPISRGLVGEERVEDEREGSTMILEAVREGVCGLPPQGPIGLVELRQDLLLGERFAVQLIPGRAQGLVEEAGPGTFAGDVLLGQDFLLGLTQYVLFPLILGLQVMAVVGQRLVGQELLHPVFVEGHPFRLHKNETLLNAVDGLPHRLAEGPSVRVVGVGRPMQVRVSLRPSEAVLNRGQTLQRLRQRLGTQGANSTPVLIREGGRVGIDLLQGVLQGLRILVQIIEGPPHIVGPRLHRFHRCERSSIAKKETAPPSILGDRTVLTDCSPPPVYHGPRLVVRTKATFPLHYA